MQVEEGLLWNGKNDLDDWNLDELLHSMEMLRVTPSTPLGYLRIDGTPIFPGLRSSSSPRQHISAVIVMMVVITIVCCCCCV